MNTSPEAPSIAQAASTMRAVVAELESVIVGQSELLRGLVLGLLADGHVLLEGLPGLAKSLAVESLARAAGGTCHRIQFTPDLLPSDLIGTQVYQPNTGEWAVHEGPIFGNFVLADEINRSPAKVQSALLEAMQERQVSLAGETRALPQPFLVLATQNPLEQEGTYPLPEAQLDRFMFKLVVGYPSRDEEKRVIDRMAALDQPRAKQVVCPEDVLLARKALDLVHVDDKIRDYVVDLVFATREPEVAGMMELKDYISYGASPRASLALTRAARAVAVLDDRDYVTPLDVKAVANEVLRHRVVLSFEAEADSLDVDQVLQTVLDTVAVP